MISRVNDLSMRTKTGNGPEVDLERLLEDIKVVVRDGQEMLKSGWAGVREKAITQAKTTDRKVRQNPYQTMGLVFGAGLIMGLLCSRMFTGSDEEEEGA